MFLFVIFQVMDDDIYSMFSQRDTAGIQSCLNSFFKLPLIQLSAEFDADI
jgi:hypothetical protein